MLNVTDNISQVLSFTDRLHDQYRFAVALALTDTVRTIAQAMPAEVDRVFKGGAVPFTRNGFYFTPARKDNLTATVGIKRLQAEYLRWQVDGGDRAPKKVALRIPEGVTLTAQGNLPAGTIRRLVALARSQRGMTKATAKRITGGAHVGTTVFYGEPKGNKARPAGLYLRLNHGAGAKNRELRAMVLFPKRPAHYAQRFDFRGLAKRQALATFGPTLTRSWQRALSTAR